MIYRPVPDREVAAFRKWLYSTPVRDQPKPNAPTHAFDSAAPWMAFDRALKRRGISSQTFWSEYGRRLGRKALAKQAYDEEQSNKKFEREQYAGPDDDHPYALAHPELAEYLRSKGFSDEEIESACQAASGDLDMAADDPTDLAHGGEPRPGGSMTAFRPDGNGNTKQELRRGAMDARALAMDAAMRIATDVPVGEKDSATRDARLLNHVRGKMDAHTHAAHMAQTAKGFEARWPDAAKIKIG